MKRKKEISNPKLMKIKKEFPNPNKVFKEYKFKPNSEYMAMFL